MKNNITFGAIRWDAWYGHREDRFAICHQVEKTLSPAKYHWRAPFFAQETPEGGIRFPAYTQETFDREMEYAAEAGIDYFAYCWYDGDLGLAKRLHQTSRYREQVKLCAMMDSNGIGKEYARQEMAYLLQQPWYMTVCDGRPLIYYFGTNRNYDTVGEDIVYYKELCAKLGLPEPYSVLMGGWPEPSKAIGADALSRYSIGASDGISFARLAENAEGVWTHHQHTGLDNVLPLTAGWHPIPRAENPVHWMHVEANSFAQYATPAEIGAHIRHAYEYLLDPANDPETPAKTVILYAWNEHDEGGWICPTVAVDEQGHFLKDENGRTRIDRSRLDEVKKAIQYGKSL